MRVDCRFPVGLENDLTAIIDLIKMKAYYFDGEKKATKFAEEEIPADLV